MGTAKRNECLPPASPEGPRQHSVSKTIQKGNWRRTQGESRQEQGAAAGQGFGQGAPGAPEPPPGWGPQGSF